MANNVTTTPDEAEPATSDRSWERVRQRFHVGQIVHGIVGDVQAYGVFFDIGATHPAFLDILEAPSEPLEAGRETWLKITQFADWNKQIRVTLAENRETLVAELNHLDAGESARLEGEFLFLQTYYSGLASDDKRELRNVVQRLAEMRQTLRRRALQAFNVRLDLSQEFYDRTGELAHSRHGSYNPEFVLEALNAWDRGEEFVPSLWKLLTSPAQETNTESE